MRWLDTDFLSYPCPRVNLWFPEGGNIGYLIALSPLCHVDRTTRVVGSLRRAATPVFRAQQQNYLSQRTSSFPHAHPALSIPNLPIIIPPKVPFSCIIKICRCVCLPMFMRVCVWLRRLSAAWDLCLLDSQTSRAGRAFHSLFLICPPHQQYASPWEAFSIDLKGRHLSHFRSMFRGAVVHWEETRTRVAEWLEARQCLSIVRLMRSSGLTLE